MMPLIFFILAPCLVQALGEILQWLLRSLLGYRLH